MHTSRIARIAFCLLFAASSPSAFGQRQDLEKALQAIDTRGIQHSDLPAFLEVSHLNDGVWKRNSSRNFPPDLYLFVGAIRRAGNSNDPFWIPYLKPLLKRKKIGNDDVGKAAQLALAKLGEKQQLQEIACEANFGSPSMRSNVVQWDLPYLKGWFSIGLLASWLDENYKVDGILRDKPGGDVFFYLPPELALSSLPNLLPDAPIPKPGPIWIESRKQDVLAPIRQAWRDWIHENEDSLRKLTPTGEGLDISRSTCKRVLAHDRHFDRSGLAK